MLKKKTLRNESYLAFSAFVETIYIYNVSVFVYTQKHAYKEKKNINVILYSYIGYKQFSQTRIGKKHCI